MIHRKTFKPHDKIKGGCTSCVSSSSQIKEGIELGKGQEGGEGDEIE